MGTYLGTSIPTGLGDGLSSDVAKELERIDLAQEIDRIDPTTVGSVPSDPYAAAEQAAHTKAPHAPDLTNLHHNHHAPTGQQIPEGYQGLAKEYGLPHQQPSARTPLQTGTWASQPASGLASQVPPVGHGTQPSGAPAQSAADQYGNYGVAITDPTSGEHGSKVPVQYRDAGQLPGHQHPHHRHHHEPTTVAAGLPSQGSLTSPQAYRTTDPIYANKVTSSTASLAPSSKQPSSQGEYEGLGVGAMTGAGLGQGSDIALAGSNPAASSSAHATPYAARGTAADALKHDEPAGRTVEPASDSWSTTSLAPSSKEPSFDTKGHSSLGEYEGLGAGTVTGAGVGHGSDIAVAGYNPTPSKGVRPAPAAAHGSASDALKHDEPAGRTVGPASGTARSAPLGAGNSGATAGAAPGAALGANSTPAAKTADSAPGAYPGSVEESNLKAESTPGNILASLVAAPAGALASVYEWIHPETGEKQTGPRPDKVADSAAPSNTTGAGATRHVNDSSSLSPSTASSAPKAPVHSEYSAYTEPVPTSKVDLSSSGRDDTTTFGTKGGLGGTAVEAITAPLETLAIAGGAAGLAGSSATRGAGNAAQCVVDGTGNVLQKASDGVSGAFSSTSGQSSTRGAGATQGTTGQTPAYASAIAAPLESLALAGEGAGDVRDATLGRTAKGRTGGTPAYASAVAAPLETAALAGEGAHDVGQAAERRAAAAEPAAIETLSIPARSAAVPADAFGALGSSSAGPTPSQAASTTGATPSAGIRNVDVDSIPKYSDVKQTPSSGLHSSHGPSASYPATAAGSTGINPTGTRNVDVDSIPTYGDVKQTASSGGPYASHDPASSYTATGGTGIVQPKETYNHDEAFGSSTQFPPTGQGHATATTASTVNPRTQFSREADSVPSYPQTKPSVPAASSGAVYGSAPSSAHGGASYQDSNLGAGVPAIAALSTPVDGKFVDPYKTDETSSVPLAGRSSRGANQVLEEGQFPPSSNSTTVPSHLHGSEGQNLGAGVPAVAALSTPVDGKFVDPYRTDETSSVPLAGRSSRGANQVLEEGQFPKSSGSTGSGYGSGGLDKAAPAGLAARSVSATEHAKLADPSKTSHSATSSAPQAFAAGSYPIEGQGHHYPTDGEAVHGGPSAYATPIDEASQHDKGLGTGQAAYPHSRYPDAGYPQSGQSGESAYSQSRKGDIAEHAGHGAPVASALAGAGAGDGAGEGASSAAASHAPHESKSQTVAGSGDASSGTWTDKHTTSGTSSSSVDDGKHAFEATSSGAHSHFEPGPNKPNHLYLLGELDDLIKGAPKS